MTIQYDSNGIITQTLSEILDERENNLKSIMGEDFVIDKTSPIGNMQLADANSELTIQELIAWLIPNMIDANTATGYFLDCICEKNRIYRKQPEYTTLNLILNGTPKTSILKEDLTVSDSNSGIYYNLNEDCVIGENGTVVAKFKCQDYGEYFPISTSVFNILTPINGLNSVTIDYVNSNIVTGRLTETDDELRRRREYSVGQTATSTMASMKSAIYSLDGVNFVTYFENDSESEDENGLPMKSFEFIVDGGDEVAITDVIFNNKTVGSRAFGTTEVDKYDSEGNIYAICYTKATEINIGIDIEVKVDSLQSTTWQNKVKQALKNKFDSIQGIGNIIKDYNYYVILTQFPEITDIVSINFYNIEDPDKTTYTQFPIDKKEIGKLNVNNISITTRLT